MRGTLALSLVSMLAPAGCYRSTLWDGGDAGPGAPAMDATPAVDAADGDAETDGGSDAGADASRSDAGRCAPLEMVLEARWPSGAPLDYPSRVHVTSTPLVLPPSSPGRAARLAFVSHGTLVDSSFAENTEGPLGTGRMPVELGGVLRIVDLATGETTSVGDPPNFTMLAPTATLAAGDLDRDGELELVALGAWGHLHAFELTGERLWTARTPAFPPILGSSGLRPLLSVSGAPAIADLDGDGALEVVFGNCVVEGATGARRFCIDDEELSAAQGYWGPLDALADLDGDGRLDVLAGRVAFSGDGEVLWRLDDELNGFATMGEVLAAHPGPEVVLIRRSRLYLLHPSDGRVVWEDSLPGAPSAMPSGCPGFPSPAVPVYAGGSPLLVDVDDDGQHEVAVANWGALVLMDPACEGCALRWSVPIDDSLSGVTGVTAADLDGDGALELVHAGATEMIVVDARTGVVRERVTSFSRTRTEYPVIADVDRDHSAEIVVASSSESCHVGALARPNPPGIAVYGERFGRWVDVASEWTQHLGSLVNGRWQPTLGPGAPFEAGCD